MLTQQQIAHLNALQIEIHENAKNKGFYSAGTSDTMLLALILGELCEGLEAFRVGKNFSHKWTKEAHETANDFFEQMNNWFVENNELFVSLFDDFVKGTLEEEFADVVIRCLDFMALKEMKLLLRRMYCDNAKPNFEENFFTISRLVNSCQGNLLYLDSEIDLLELNISNIVNFMFTWATQLGFDLMPFIELKMKYNTTHEPLHGKKF